jgi:hypothetical protein
MKMNKNMSALMQRYRLRWPLTEHPLSSPPELEVIDGCVLLKGEYDSNKHVTIESCIDRTGYESFLNHVHFFGETKALLTDSLDYAASLQRSLATVATDRQFRVIVGISDDGGTVRFHQIRPGEDGMSNDLERYASQAILVFDVLQE